MTGSSRPKVVYLIGAGASHGCVKRANSQQGILMRDLGQPLNDKLHEVINEDEFIDNDSLKNLVNAVINENTDFEHVISFLDDSPSRVHRDFADRMRKVFHEILDGRLKEIRAELGRDPVDLYAALLDMYQLSRCPEELQGIITLNYDNYIEEAVKKVTEKPVNFGFNVEQDGETSGPLKLLKLHGSFYWKDTWPTTLGDGEDPLWIPPGIQKSKQAYPFNVLWGLAREMLSCDVLRIIGCRLGPNDWDLISLIFTTRHLSSQYRPYQIEIIDWPGNAKRLKSEFPYLDVRSILELEDIGEAVIGELSKDGTPRPFNELNENEQDEFIESLPKNVNWFETWLIQTAEFLFTELEGEISTEKDLLKQLMEEGS